MCCFGRLRPAARRARGGGRTGRWVCCAARPGKIARGGPRTHRPHGAAREHHDAACDSSEVLCVCVCVCVCVCARVCVCVCLKLPFCVALAPARRPEGHHLDAKEPCDARPTSVRSSATCRGSNNSPRGRTETGDGTGASLFSSGG